MNKKSLGQLFDDGCVYEKFLNERNKSYRTVRSILDGSMYEISDMISYSNNLSKPQFFAVIIVEKEPRFMTIPVLQELLNIVEKLGEEFEHVHVDNIQGCPCLEPDEYGTEIAIRMAPKSKEKEA